MKKITLFLAAFVALSCAQAHAATAPAPVAAPSAQESKMKQCASAYHARKIEKSQYRAFMSVCLKKDANPATVAIPAGGVAPKKAAVASPKAPVAAAAPTAPTAAAPVAAAPVTETPAAAATTAPTSQKDKMKACNANAKTQSLKGDARKSFMKTCLSN